ncbi:MAG: hypothetical protein JSS83_18735 [Cyanobacteria bacterium SZAS LIN-3]|nr:hypothetical protein [Cyanobacteria bacterium SZAS LIN-3]
MSKKNIALRLTIFFLINLTPPALLIVVMARLMTHVSWLGAVGLLTATIILTPLLVVAGNLLARMAVRPGTRH